MTDPKTKDPVPEDSAAASFQKHQAAMIAGWSPEVRAFAETLRAELDLARWSGDLHQGSSVSQRPRAERPNRSIESSPILP